MHLIKEVSLLKNSLFGFMSLLLSGAQILRGISAVRRPGVVYTGTTLNPGFKRVEGIEAPACGEGYPFSFDWGRKCCRNFWKKDNQTLDTGCDGSKINYYGARQCCKNDEFQDCPARPQPCNDLRLRKHKLM